MHTYPSISAALALPEKEGAKHMLPVWLKLEQMPLLIVGGGTVAWEKLTAVLAYAPNTSIQLIAENIVEEIWELAKNNSHISIVQKSFEQDDLDSISIAIIAIGNKAISAAIHKMAKDRQLLVHVPNMPNLSDFFIPEGLQKGIINVTMAANGNQLDETATMQPFLGTTQTQDEGIGLQEQQLDHSAGSYSPPISLERTNKWRRIAKWSLVIFGSMLIGHFIFSYIPFKALASGTIDFYLQLDKNFGWILLAGFLAQIIDGSLGMGYGITSATIMLSLGVNPAVMSGSIHTAEMFASGASGLSHYRFGNVNMKLFKAIVIPGVIGAIAGAWLLVKFGESHAQYLRPIMACYTLFLGVKFIINAFRKTVPKQKFKHYKLLAGAGGFLDSFGGGGWGPIVTSTLINRGRTPKYVIGTVSLTEFFVTLSSAFAFFMMIGVSHWQAIVALIIGSLVAAPIAARLAGKMPRKTAFLLLGILVVFWSCRIIVKLF